MQARIQTDATGAIAWVSLWSPMLDIHRTSLLVRKLFCYADIIAMENILMVKRNYLV